MFRFVDPEWLFALATVPLLAALFWAGAVRRRRALDGWVTGTWSTSSRSR